MTLNTEKHRINVINHSGTGEKKGLFGCFSVNRCFIPFVLMIFTSGFPLALDYVSFRFSKNLNLVELYYSVPYQDLIYRTEHDSIIADVRIDYSIHSFFSPDSIVDSAYRRLSLFSFKQAQQRDLTMVDQVVFYARPGKYWLNFTVSSPNPEKPAKIGFLSDTFEINDFSDSLGLSDIEMAAQISLDTTEGKFNKSGLLIMPNPSGQFGLAYDQINVYLELYNMMPDSFPFEITYAVLDSNRMPIKTFTPEKRKKDGSSVSLTFALSAKGLKPGSYFLFVRLRDLSIGKEVTKYKRFFIASPAVISQKSVIYRPISAEERRYYEAIQFLATEREIRQFKKLSVEGKEKFLETFWAKHDFPEFLSRIQYTDLHFGFGRKEGHETDRGRIYIKYGPPDEIEDLPMTEYSNPQQRWRYYNKGLIFVFVDINGNGNLQFIYSNTREERNHPDWEKYINTEEIHE
jgi:GWxTD domain-containing protein